MHVTALIVTAVGLLLSNCIPGTYKLHEALHCYPDNTVLKHLQVRTLRVQQFKQGHKRSCQDLCICIATRTITATPHIIVTQTHLIPGCKQDWLSSSAVCIAHDAFLQLRQDPAQVHRQVTSPGLMHGLHSCLHVNPVWGHPVLPDTHLLL